MAGHCSEHKCVSVSFYAFTDSYIKSQSYFVNNFPISLFQIAKLGTQMESQKLDLIKYLVGE